MPQMWLRKKIPIISSPFFKVKNGDIFLIAEIWEKGIDKCVYS